MFPHIALHGRAGVGKDTVGEYLGRQHGHVNVALADMLRAYLEEANPLIIRDADSRAVPLNTLLAEYEGSWDLAKRANPHLRQTLTGFGHGARNIFGPEFWVREFRKSFDQFQREIFAGAKLQAVITDVRYANELDLLGAYFNPLFSIKIIRPGHDKNGHASEDGLPDELFDAVIENNGTIAELYADVESTLTLNNIAGR